jgi:hypothetical protein
MVTTPLKISTTPLAVSTNVFTSLMIQGRVSLIRRSSKSS